MSTDKRVKVYKNPARNSPETHKQYVPQYQLMGVEPEEHKGFSAQGTRVEVAKPSTDNPRAARPAMRQPYAEAVASPVGRGRGLLPNVGNNMEQTWSSVDGIVDDVSALEVDPGHQMVDNNEFVSAAALGLPEETDLEEDQEVLPTLDEVVTPPKKQFVEDQPKTFLTKNQLQEALSGEYLTKVIQQLEEDEYLLLVSGECVCSGSGEYVQEQTRLLIFGEHELYNGNPVSVDDIVVIKRTKIKVGVFLE